MVFVFDTLYRNLGTTFVYLLCMNFKNELSNQDIQFKYELL